MALSAQEAAILRKAMAGEAQALRKDMTNTISAGGEYPRMLFRKTLEADVHVISTDKLGKPAETLTRNSFDGLLCDTTIAEDADEAEQLASEGWDVSPQAAHGIASTLVTAATAKDEEIARLRAELAARDADDAPRRGRPPRTLASESEIA